MRRLVLSASAVPGQGGQGINLLHMFEGLRLNFDLEIFCRGRLPGASGRLVPPCRSSELIGRVPFVRRLRDWSGYLADRQFDRYVAGRLPAASLFQGATGQCLESLRTAREKGYQTVLDVTTLHVDDFGAAMDPECGRFGIRPALHRYQREVIRREYGEAGHIRVMSEVARQTFLRRGFDERRVVVARPPMDREDFPQADFDGSTFRISFAGLIEPWKGFHHLVEAFHRLNRSDAELVFWGGPGSRPVSKYLAEHQARNSGIQVRPVNLRSVGFRESYGRSHVLVHPSLSDGFGYVVAEAMACGLPVIVTSCSGASDLVTDGTSGYVIQAGDVDGLRDRLAHLADRPSLVRTMGQAAREAVRGLTLNHFRETYAKFLEHVVA